MVEHTREFIIRAVRESWPCRGKHRVLRLLFWRRGHQTMRQELKACPQFAERERLIYAFV